MKKEIEKTYTKKQIVQILKRLVDTLAKEKAFRMQIKGKKVYIPIGPEVEIEYQKEKNEEKIEIEIKWKK